MNSNLGTKWYIFLLEGETLVLFAKCIKCFIYYFAKFLLVFAFAQLLFVKTRRFIREIDFLCSFMV